MLLSIPVIIFVSIGCLSKNLYAQKVIKAINIAGSIKTNPKHFSCSASIINIRQGSNAKRNDIMRLIVKNGCLILFILMNFLNI